jgi:RNA-binding protein PNO1
MPAPTALQRRPEALAEDLAMAEAIPLPAEEPTELLDTNLLPSDPSPAPQNPSEIPTEDTVMTDETGRPRFAPAPAIPIAFRHETRKVPVPPHRMTPLKASCMYSQASKSIYLAAIFQNLAAKT